MPLHRIGRIFMMVFTDLRTTHWVRIHSRSEIKPSTLPKLSSALSLRSGREMFTFPLKQCERQPKLVFPQFIVNLVQGYLGWMPQLYSKHWLLDAFQLPLIYLSIICAAGSSMSLEPSNKKPNICHRCLACKNFLVIA